MWDGTEFSDFTSRTDTGSLSIPEFEGSAGDRQIKLGMYGDSMAAMGQDHWAGLGSVHLTVGDDVDPVMTVDMPDGWIDESPFEIPITAEDNGLGILYVLMLTGKRGGHVLSLYSKGEIICDEYDAETAYIPIDCPLSTPPGFALELDPMDLREGITAPSFLAAGLPENSDEQQHTLRIDTMDPVVNLAGTFTTAPGMVLDGPSYSLESDASDGSGTGNAANSGVVEIEVLIDDVAIDSDSDTCGLAGNCTLGLDTDIDPDDYTNGEHVLKVKATDAVGHVKTETVEFEVDR